MAPAEGTEDTKELNVAAQTLGGSDGSDGGASDDKEDEEETKFVEWDPSGRFGRVREISAAPFFFLVFSAHLCMWPFFTRSRRARRAKLCTSHERFKAKTGAPYEPNSWPVDVFSMGLCDSNKPHEPRLTRFHSNFKTQKKHRQKNN
jgi:hypothetical protein